MSPTPAERLATVVALLEARGWLAAGGTSNPPTHIARIPGSRYVGRPGSERQRLRKGNWRVTVGSRTTCFYRVVEGEAIFEPGRNPRTDESVIAEYLDALERQIARGQVSP